MSNLTRLACQAFITAYDKGFWHHPDTGEPICPRDVIGEKIALMHSELSEALEEVRNGHLPTLVYYRTDSKGNQKPEGFPIEMADCLIRILSFCEALGVDIEEAVQLKMTYNEKREHRHGGKAL